MDTRVWHSRYITPQDKIFIDRGQRTTQNVVVLMWNLGTFALPPDVQGGWTCDVIRPGGPSSEGKLMSPTAVVSLSLARRRKHVKVNLWFCQHVARMFHIDICVCVCGWVRVCEREREMSAGCDVMIWDKYWRVIIILPFIISYHYHVLVNICSQVQIESWKWDHGRVITCWCWSVIDNFVRFPDWSDVFIADRLKD